MSDNKMDKNIEQRVGEIKNKDTQLEAETSTSTGKLERCSAKDVCVVGEPYSLDFLSVNRLLVLFLLSFLLTSCLLFPYFHPFFFGLYFLHDFLHDYVLQHDLPTLICLPVRLHPILCKFLSCSVSSDSECNVCLLTHTRQ